MIPLRFTFPGLDSISKSYSQCFQDLFVLAVLNGKRNGTFLEIGAFDPTFISNTYLLESQFDWRGVSIDINQIDFSQRKATFIKSNALDINYYKLLFGNFETHIDYLSIDIEPNFQTLRCLKLLPLDDVTFSVITYETDVYDPNNPKEMNEKIRDDSRSYLKEHGYILVAGNISNLDDQHPFEDWYVHKDYFTYEWIQGFKRITDLPISANRYMLHDSD